MKNSKTNETVASIDVGSNYLKMTIADIKTTGEITILEDLIKPTKIGKDTFSIGRISVENIHKTCEDLKGFSQIMKDYKIKNYRAIATSGIREAQNRQYILEQIRLRTGIKVECINVSQERFYIMKALRYTTTNFDFLNPKTTSLVLNITTGSVESSIFKDGKLKFTEHAQIGSLRVREMLGDLEYKTSNFTDMMKQYIESKLYLVKTSLNKYKIKNFIAMGGELNSIVRLINSENKENSLKYIIHKDDYRKLYNKIKNMSNDQISFKYGISKNKIDLIIPTILIFYSFLDLTESDIIYTPSITLRLGMLEDLSDESFNLERRYSSIEDILNSTLQLSDKYKINKAHSEYVEKIALCIFDGTVKIHKLGPRQRLYLQVSSRLHDIGNFIDSKDHENQSYNIIRCQDIMGFSKNELNIIANIAKYHFSIIPKENDENYSMLDHHDKMTVSILAAILKLAESLDASHLQKIQDIKLSSSSNMLYFNLASKEDLSLEEWNFKQKSNFFEEVLGVRPVI